ncbi:hypothetical protein DYE50_04945 [Treponema ruminis]|nr:hypothetical protein DYE50_04945 [Treponema ruminis]
MLEIACLLSLLIKKCVIQNLGNELFGALRGVPAEGVADKQQSGENRRCLQRRFVERLAWERGEGFPLLNIKQKEQNK